MITSSALLVQDLKCLLSAAPLGGLPMEVCHILDEARLVVRELEAMLNAERPLEPTVTAEPTVQAEAPQITSPALVPEGIDPSALDQLIALLPPDQAPLLIQSFLSDLGAVRQGFERTALLPAAQAEDELGPYLHNLISLAGTAGAHQLHDRACALQAARSAEDQNLAQALLPSLRDELDLLLGYLEMRANRLGLRGAAA